MHVHGISKKEKKETLIYHVKEKQKTKMEGRDL